MSGMVQNPSSPKIFDSSAVIFFPQMFQKQKIKNKEAKTKQKQKTIALLSFQVFGPIQNQSSHKL